MNAKQQVALEESKRILVHYFGTLANNAGMRVDRGDLEAEVRAALDLLVEACTPPARSEHEDLVEQLRTKGRADLEELHRRNQAEAEARRSSGWDEAEKLAPSDPRD